MNDSQERAMPTFTPPKPEYFDFWLITTVVIGTFPFLISLIEAIEEWYFPLMIDIAVGYVLIIGSIYLVAFNEQQRCLTFYADRLCEYTGSSIQWRVHYVVINSVDTYYDRRSGKLRTISLHTASEHYKIRGYEEMEEILDHLQNHFPAKVLIADKQIRTFHFPLWATLIILIAISIIFGQGFDLFFSKVFLLFSTIIYIGYVWWRIADSPHPSRNVAIIGGVVLTLIGGWYLLNNLAYYNNTARLSPCGWIDKHIRENGCIRSLLRRGGIMTLATDMQTGDTLLVRPLGNGILIRPIHLWQHIDRWQYIPHDMPVDSTWINEAGNRLYIFTFRIQPLSTATATNEGSFLTDDLETVYDLTLVDLENGQILDRQQRVGEFEPPWQTFSISGRGSRPVQSVITVSAQRKLVVYSTGQVDVWEWEEAKEDSVSLEESLDDWVVNSPEIEVPNTVPLYSLKFDQEPGCAFFLPPDDLYFVIMEGSRVHTFNSLTGEPQNMLSDVSNRSCPPISSDGQLMAIFRRQSPLQPSDYIQLHDPVQGDSLGKIDLTGFDFIHNVVFSPDNQYIAVEVSTRIFIFDLTQILTR